MTAAWPRGVKHGETGARRRQGAVLATGHGTLAIKRPFGAGLLRFPQDPTTVLLLVATRDSAASQRPASIPARARRRRGSSLPRRHRRHRVVIANQRCLRVRPGFDRASLVRLIDALEDGGTTCRSVKRKPLCRIPCMVFDADPLPHPVLRTISTKNSLDATLHVGHHG